MAEEIGSTIIRALNDYYKTNIEYTGNGGAEGI